jgi:hypothetical protein
VRVVFAVASVAATGVLGDFPLAAIQNSAAAEDVPGKVQANEAIRDQAREALTEALRSLGAGPPDRQQFSMRTGPKRGHSEFMKRTARKF